MDDDLAARRDKLRRLLRVIRRERGVTQIEVSERTGMAQSVISKYENGERRLDFVEVEAVCGAMNMSLRSFLRRWESTPDHWEEE